MRATMSFSLPDESEEHQAALQGMDLREAVRLFERYLRDTMKHGGLPEGSVSVLYDVQTKLINYLEEYGVTLY